MGTPIMWQPPRPWRSGVGEAENLSLTEYVRQLIPKGNDMSRIFCNSSGVPMKPPILRHGVPNTIIVFPGRFNPPHLNHIQILRHVVTNAGQDLNIIAAVVCIKDEDEVRKSLEEKGEELDLVFSEQQRTELWAGPELPVDWVWIHNSHQCDWRSTRNMLAERALQDGFDLRFLMLCGPEHFSVREEGPAPENPKKWGCEGWITSDTGMRADFVFTNENVQPPVLSRNCTQWVPVVPDAKDVRNIARSKFIVNDSHDLENLDPRRQREEELKIRASARGDWVCRYNRSPFLTVRYIPTFDRSRLEVTGSELRKYIRHVQIQHMPGIEAAFSRFVPHPRWMLQCAVGCREEYAARMFDWPEYGNHVERHLKRSIADRSLDEVDMNGEPDEEALYQADILDNHYALPNISDMTRVSALRSTIFTHANGAHFLAQTQPLPYDLWGPNIYPNEPAPDQEESTIQWAPTWEYGLPEM